MAGRKSARNAERVERQEPVHQPIRKSGILSPHEELRERLLETAIDIKENIPERRVTSGSGSTSDGSETRKRRSTKEGPAAKRPSTEKARDGSNGDDSVEYISEERSMSSVGSRSRGYALPVMLEEDEVFEFERSTEFKQITKMTEKDYGGKNEKDEEPECEDEDEEEEDESYEDEQYDEEEDSEEEDDFPIQNKYFLSTKMQMNEKTIIPAPSLLSNAKCDGIGSPAKVWSLMVKRDELPRATACLLNDHPDMTVSMRRLLVDWMMEVCESEKMHRETFHLAVDYVDRCLEAASTEFTNTNFQLVGTAALFIAAKYEEIYPPKCADFANLTDGAFSVEDIRQMEIIMVNDIGWSLGPITSIHWLSTYLQLLGTGQRHIADEHYEERNMYVPELLRTEFIEMCKIIDYLLLEIDSFEFSYRTIAAAVLFVNYEPTSAVERATGFTSEQLSQVIRYVRPVCNVFARLRDDTEVLPVHSQINADDTHNIQVHIKFQDYEDLVKEEREKLHGRARQH